MFCKTYWVIFDQELQVLDGLKVVNLEDAGLRG